MYIYELESKQWIKNRKDKTNQFSGFLGSRTTTTIKQKNLKP